MQEPSAQRLLDLLARGGSGLTSHVPKYNGLADPPGAEELASALARRLAGPRPTAIVVWEDPEDVVLGHVVARELGLSVVRAFDADGLVGQRGVLPEAARVALVSDAVRDPRVVLAVSQLVERAGGRLVATGVLVETPELRASVERAGDIVAIGQAVEEPVDGEPAVEVGEGGG